MVIIWLGTKYTLIEKQPFPFEYEKNIYINHSVTQLIIVPKSLWVFYTMV